MIGTIGSTAVGGYQPPNLNKVLSNLFQRLDSSGSDTAVAAAGDETETGQKTAVASVSGPSTGQLSNSIMSVLFMQQLQAGAAEGQQPPPPGAAGDEARQAALKSFYAGIDVNGDGAISQAELSDYLKANGGTEDEANKIFAALDSDGNGDVSESELNGAIESGRPRHGGHRPPPPDPAEIADKVFSRIDADGDGSLTKAELEAFVTSKGGTVEQADSDYAALDSGGTGSVTKEQFKAAAAKLAELKPEPPASRSPDAATAGKSDPSPWLRFLDALATVTSTQPSTTVTA